MILRENVAMDKESTFTGYMKVVTEIETGKQTFICHGQGKKIWKDGSFYDGDWVDGMAHGCGYFSHLNGDYYDGQFYQDKANGQGTYRHNNG